MNCASKIELRTLYLHLLANSLTGTISNDPPIDPWHGVLHDESGKVVQLGEAGGALSVSPGEYSPALRYYGLDWPATACTMIGIVRLLSLHEMIFRILHDNVPGDLLEAGVWRGGASVFMRAVLKSYSVTDRRVFVADSFQGLPAPDEKNEHDKGYWYHAISTLRVSEDEVRTNFLRYGLLDEQVVFVPGFFNESMPVFAVKETGQLALLRLDADMYGSTMDVLGPLYARVPPGGFIVVDDYDSDSPARRAVLEFREKHGIADPIADIDGQAVYWRKT